MNMLKRSFAMLLALCMLVSAVPVNAIAAEATDRTEPIVLETDAPEVTEAPIESETPTESEVPTESEIPTEGETIGEEETPTEGATVPEEETPTEGVTVPEEETPTEGVTIPEEETPTEEETVPEETEEFFEIGWVSEEAISGVNTGTNPGSGGPVSGEPFIYGTAGSNSFRIPALVTLSNGYLLAAADARWNTTYDGGGLDTIVSVSSDNGDNWYWSMANYLGDNGNEYNGSSSTAFIDPALAVSGNTVYMLCDLYPYGIALNGSGNTHPSTDTGFNSNGYLKLDYNGAGTYSYYLDGTTIRDSSGNAVSGYTVDKYFNITGTGVDSNLFFSDSPFKVARTGFLYLTKSTDGGESWSAPELLNLKNGSEQVCLVAPGRGLVTSDGDVVFPTYHYHYNNNNPIQYLSFISMDPTTGKWTRSASMTGASWSSESAVVELEDGTLRFFYRNGTTNLCYVDYNNGWQTPVTMTSIDTNSNCQISAITYSKTIDGKQVILVSCPTGPSEAGSDQSGASYRKNGKIFLFIVNEDKTLTLKASKNVTSNDAQFMYSCLTEQKDGSVSILYEDKENAWGTGDSCYYTMSFATYDVAKDFGVTLDAVLTNQATGVKVQFANTDNQTYTMTVTPNQTVAALEEEYVAFDVTITNAGGTKYEGSASVTLPLGALADKTGIYPFVVETDGTVTKIETFTGENGNITFTAPHFSVLGAAVEAQEPVISGEDTVTSNGQSGPAYVLDTDGTIDAGDTYVIVSNGNAFGMGSTSSATNVTVTENSDGTLTIPTGSNIDLALWKYQNSGLYNTAYSRYVYIGGSYLSWQTTSQTVNIASAGNGTYTVYRQGYYSNSYLRYNSGWTGGSANNATAVKFYKYSAGGTAVWSVDAALQESRIAAYTVENEGYTDASWNAYQAALTAAQNKLAEVEGATYTTEVAANTAKTDLIAVVDALEEAKNALVKAVAITVRYQVNGTTVVTATMNVGANDTSVTLPTMVTDANGDMYTVDNTTLSLTGATVYNVPVTKLEGYPITVSRGSEITVSPADPYGDSSVTGVELADGQYIKWSSEDSAYVGVAGVYNATSLAYTDEAVIKGTQETEQPIKVTGTVYNSDGTVASTYVWLVTVTAPDSDTTATTRYFAVDQIENCTLYYSINGGNLIQINGTGLAIDYIDPQQNDDPYTVIGGAWYDDMSLIFFAAPDEGYALTHMWVEDSANQYYVLSDGNADGTGSSAWPLQDGVSADAVYTSGGHTYSLSEVASLYLLGNQTIYEAIKASGNVWKSLDTNNDGIVKSDEYHGLRWALLEGYMDINHLKALYTEALALGCTGVTTVTRGFTNNKNTGTENDPISICAVAQKLPTLEKKISSITKAEGGTISEDNVATAALEIGDTLHYTLKVTVYATNSVVHYWDGTTLTNGTTATISYSNIDVKDTMKTDLNWTDTTAKSSTSSDQYLETTYQITLAASNWLQYVENGKILNTAELTYDYVASYGTGSYGGKSSASVEAYVVLPEYVIDFGASIEIDLTNDPLVADYDKLKSATAMYGDISFNENTLKLTYTPNQILPGIDFIRIEVEDTTGSQKDSLVGYGVRIYPATTVYYEEGYIFDSNSGWDNTTGITKSPGTQTSEKLSPPTRDEMGAIIKYESDKQNPYGYDALYVNDIKGSNETAAYTQSLGSSDSFTFTGTGFDLYANCADDDATTKDVDESTGRVSVQVRNTAGKLVKVYTVDTVVKGGETVATAGQTGEEYHLPIVSVDGLDHDTYTVKLVKIVESEKPVKIDGVRIHNTLKDSSVFTIDKEDDPVFYELRDAVLKAVDVSKTASEMYGDDWMNDKSLIGPLAEQVYGDLSTTDTVSAVVTSVSDIYSGDADAQDLLDNGPKNELFLYPSQTLTFKVTTDREMQIGLKAPRAATAYTLKYEVDNATKTVATEKALNTSVDMFYALGNPTGSSKEYTVSVTNTGSDILSVTDLKICDDPNAAFVPLTVDDIEYILTQAGVGGQEPAPEEPTDPEEPIVPEEPEVPVIEYADAVLKIKLVDYTGKQLAAAELTANGIKGEENAFAGAAVLRMAERNLPKGYALVSKQADAVKVAYGEETTVSVQIGKVATVKVTFVNLLGRKVGTATITKVQTSAAPCRITAAEIRSLAPVGRLVIRLTSVTAAFGSTTNVIVPVV